MGDSMSKFKFGDKVNWNSINAIFFMDAKPSRSFGECGRILYKNEKMITKLSTITVPIALIKEGWENAD